jgi:hypothetical protein
MGDIARASRLPLRRGTRLILYCTTPNPQTLKAERLREVEILA